MSPLSFQADREEMLAFLRDDLPPEAAEKLRVRLAAEPALREELSWLREAMEATDAEDLSTATMSISSDVSKGNVSSHSADALPFAGDLLAPADEVAHLSHAHYDENRFSPTPIVVEDASDIGKRATLGNWLDRQSWIVLPVLLVLLLAQAGAIAWLAAQRNQLAATLQTNTLAAIHARPSACLSVWVAPLDTASVASLKAWMTLYGGKFVEGPDVEGHIRIAFHDEMDLAAAMHDPATVKIAHRIDQPAGCTR